MCELFVVAAGTGLITLDFRAEDIKSFTEGGASLPVSRQYF